MSSGYYNGPVPVWHSKILCGRFITRAALGLGKLACLFQDMGIQRLLHTCTLIFGSSRVLCEGMAAPHHQNPGTYFEQSQVGTMPGGEEDRRVGAIARHLISLHTIPCLERKAMDPLLPHVSHMIRPIPLRLWQHATKCGRNSGMPYPRSGSTTGGRSDRPPGSP